MSSPLPVLVPLFVVAVATTTHCAGAIAKPTTISIIIIATG